MIVRVAPYRLGRMGVGFLLPTIEGAIANGTNQPARINPSLVDGSVSPISTPGVAAQTPETVATTPASSSPATTAAAPAATVTDPFTTFLTGSMLGGIPNWVLLGAGLMLVIKKKS